MLRGARVPICVKPLPEVRPHFLEFPEKVAFFFFEPLLARSVL